MSYLNGSCSLLYFLQRAARQGGRYRLPAARAISVERYVHTWVDYPPCPAFYHLRATASTVLKDFAEGDGIPLRTVQAWLGHKNLETTQRYLGITDSNKLRPQIDAAYGD